MSRQVWISVCSENQKESSPPPISMLVLWLFYKTTHLMFNAHMYLYTPGRRIIIINDHKNKTDKDNMTIDILYVYFYALVISANSHNGVYRGHVIFFYNSCQICVYKSYINVCIYGCVAVVYCIFQIHSSVSETAVYLIGRTAKPKVTLTVICASMFVMVFHGAPCLTSAQTVERSLFYLRTQIIVPWQLLFDHTLFHLWHWPHTKSCLPGPIIAKTTKTIPSSSPKPSAKKYTQTDGCCTY